MTRHEFSTMLRCGGCALAHLAFLTLVIWLLGSAVFLIWSVYWILQSPHRSLEDLLGFLLWTPFLIPLIGIGLGFVAAISFGAAQYVLGAILFVFARRLTLINGLCLVASLAVLTFISWESYDYLVPSYRFYTAPDDGDWVHGVSLQRLSVFAAIEIVLAAFSYWRLRGHAFLLAEEPRLGMNASPLDAGGSGD
jgi:hypothetical protein